MMIDVEKLNLAIAAHAQWKHLLKVAVETQKCDRTVASAKSDSVCDFGKWLLSFSPLERTSQHWQTIHKLHAEFHIAAARVLELALKGKRDEAAAELSMTGDFTRVSSQLTVAVSHWKRDLSAKP
jgi:hypothetical protein